MNRSGWMIVGLACVAAEARAQAPAPSPSGPIRVAIECEEEGRTKACPAFLLGLVDAHEVLLPSPRAGADVVIYATANEVALVDRLHLRFVGHVRGAPSVIELDVDLDTRATDDAQRATLEPVVLRGLALFVAARHPSAVVVALGAPVAMTAGHVATTPWGVALGVSANGNYTEKYRSASSELVLTGRYVTKRFRALTLEAISGGLNRQPPLVLEDGSQVSLDSHQWAARGGAEAVYAFCDRWSVGIGSYTSFEDPKAQYRYSSRTRVAVEYDRFPADDPRGNQLAVYYHAGWAVDRYNLRNALGESFAHYPVHGIDAIGSVRTDKVSYGLTLSSDVQVDHPSRRHQFTASPFIQIQLGDHVDLNLSFSITQRELPAPDPSAIDPSDYAQLSRLSYAEPLSLNGSIGLSIHWDPSNGVRNDRLASI
ncbi:MAG: hypothetical protein NT062_14160 [Proteobacteria bacterium]|nr:hypothetical protein [Pseudomonadota bacterium]